MKYAPWLLLLVAAPAHANGWEWKRQPVTADDYAEIRRIGRLTDLPRCQLQSVIESERAAFNHRAMMQYNRMLPTPLPLMPTPEINQQRRSPFRFFSGH